MPDDSSPPSLTLLPEPAALPSSLTLLPEPAALPSSGIQKEKLPIKGRSALLAVALFFLTLFTTVTVGGIFLIGARTDIATDLAPFLIPETVIRVWSDPYLLRWGFAYALPVLAILLAHELGHYLACRHYRVDSSPPYFLPSPVLLGTFGAFIRIRSAIRSKRELFDIGIAGPIAGFVLLVPFLVYGVAHSIPAAVGEVPESESAMLLTIPGSSLLYRALVFFFHGTLPDGMILNPHPFVFAAWVGAFATMLNLLPLAQLDGGHLLYAVAGRRHRRLAPLLWLILLCGGFVWPGWFLWSAIVLWLGLRHPPVWDELEPLDRQRRWWAVVAAAIFLLCFMPVPLTQLAVAAP